jgi:hypothetical protein
MKLYAATLQIFVVLGFLAVLDIATPAIEESPRIHPELKTYVHIESSPEFLEKAKQEAEPKEKAYKKNEQLSPKELKSILYKVGFRGEALRIAWGTAMKESTGRPRAHNDNPDTGDNSYGLFQINMIGDLGPARRDKFNLDSNEDLFDPVRNAEIAYFMSNKGKNWSSWHGITETTQQWMTKFPG